MKVRATVGATEITPYLKGFSVQPGGGGIVGTGTLVLDNLAGGLDLRVRQEVKLWVPFDQTAGTGIASRGRLFHGLVALRNTGNVGTTKTWSLVCGDMNILNHLLVRDANTAKQVTLSAGSFAAQIAALVALIQSNGGAMPPKQIDATNMVVDLYPTMPAVTMEAGHKLGWYIQQLCNKVRELTPGVFPKFFMGTVNTSGAGDVFGNPALHVYDGALTPAVTVSFSDTPVGAEKQVYPPFSRITDAGGDRVLQRRQAFYGPEQSLLVTALSTASQSTYPNEWMNHGQAGGSGFWMAEPMRLAVNTAAEAQALVDAEIQKSANPGDSFQWTTYELIQPYDMIGLKWDLEGIPSGTVYRVARVQVKSTDELDFTTVLSVNSRRRGLFDDGSDEWPLLPIEGDHVPPLAPAGLALTSNTWDWGRRLAAVVLTISPSPSPDTAGYRLIGTVAGQPYREDVGMNLVKVLFLAAAVAFSVQAEAYDGAGNTSLDRTAAVVGTAALPTAPPAPTAFTVSQAYQGDDEVVMHATWTHSTQPLAYRDRYELKYYQPGTADRGVIIMIAPDQTQVDFPVNAWLDYRFLIRTVGVGSVYGPWSSEVSFRPIPVEPTGVYNGGFEVSVKGAPALPDGYVRTLVGSPGGGRAEGTTAYEGRASYVANNLTSSNSVELTTEFVRVAGGRGYRVGIARVSDSNALGLLDLRVDWYDGAQAFISTSDLFLGETPPAFWLWYYNRTPVTAPGSAMFAKVRVKMSGKTGTATTVIIDGITFEAAVVGEQLEDSGVTAAAYGLVTATVDRYGRVTAAVGNSGTAFPGSPSAGQPFFRTDLGVWCYWNGTYWLSDTEVLVPWFYYEATQGGKAATSDVCFTRLPQDRALFLTNLSYLYLIQSGVHSLGNYWNIVLYRNTNADAYAAVQTSTTDKTTVGAFKETPEVPAVGSWTINPLAVDDRFLKVRVETSGSPGPILAMPTLKARYIYT